MRIFKTRVFHRWAKKERLSDAVLVKAVAEMEQGLVDADLGGHIYKKRIAHAGRGKSGGVRTIVAYKVLEKTFFMYGFAKNKRANIFADEEQVLRLLGQELLQHDDVLLEELKQVEELYEVKQDE